MLGSPIQNQLLTAIFCNNLQEITSLLQTPSTNINASYGGPFNHKTALEISCDEFISTIQQTTIQLLVQNGAKGSNALYYASCHCNVEIVKELLKNDENIKNNPVLISLIKFIFKNKKNEEDYLEIANILLQKIEINLEDESENTAIYLAAKYEYKNLVDLMLNLKHKEINLDYNYPILTINKITRKPCSIFKTARELIQSTNPRKLPEPIIENDSEITLKFLLQNIRQRQDCAFMKNYQIYCRTYPDTFKDDNSVLLMFAAEKGLINIVRYFLYIGVDSNLSSDGKYHNIKQKYKLPLIYACVRGFYETVEVLLGYANCITINESLVELVKTKFEDNEYAKINHKRCLQLLLESNCLNLAHIDENKNTVCHYAAMHQDSDTILMLLRKGSSLACKNDTGKMPIEFLDARTLEKHFDECINFIKHFNINTSQYKIEINFNSMLPNDTSTSKDKISCETQILQYISTQNELKHLLHHPVVEMFLFLKWQRVKFFISLNLVLYVLFMIILMIYIYSRTAIYSEYYFPECVTGIIRVILTVIWIFLILRELSQAFVFRLKYFTEYENWIEACLFTSTGYLIFKECASVDMKNQISALIIVTSSVELMLLSGRHFKKFFVSSMVLQTVSTTLFKWLASYIILIGSFSVGFYYIFYDQRFFKNVSLSLFKTIVMITGEFELENFEFTTNFVIGPILFIIFVFLVNIVLLGVCTALAINDIQLIINNAATKLQIIHIQHIVYWEVALSTSKLYHFENWFQRFLKIKLLQEQPVVKIRVEGKNYKGFHDNLEIDSNILKKIIARNEFSTKYSNKEYPVLNEDFFYELWKTSNPNDNFSIFNMDIS